jgi:hypothetical protein
MEMGGFVLSPTMLDPTSQSIYCVWAMDAGTMGMESHGCEGNGQCSGLESSYCWWPPSQLRQMLVQQKSLTPSHGRKLCGQKDCGYNELMLNADFWRDRLPAIVEAIFYPVGNPSGEQRARTVHAAFVRKFGLSAASVPLVKLDLTKLHAPFSLARP